MAHFADECFSELSVDKWAAPLAMTEVKNE